MTRSLFARSVWAWSLLALGAGACAVFTGNDPNELPEDAATTVDAAPHEEPSRDAEVEIDAAPDARADADVADATDAEPDASADAAPEPEPDPCLPATPAAGLVADSSAGFRTVQGECGWHYLRSGNNLSDVQSLNLFGQTWSPVSGGLPLIQQTSIHPSTSQWAVRRWVSTRAGSLRLRGRVRVTGSGGDGVTFAIYLGAASQSSIDVPAGAERSFDLTRAVSVGQNVSFAVGPKGTNANDSTELHIEILAL